MVTPRSGNFQRALCALLPFDIAQITGLRGPSNLTRLGGNKGCLAGKVFDNLMQRSRTQNLGCANPSRLGPAGPTR